MSSNTEGCIFCNKTNCKVISSTKHFFIIRDTAYPVTKHHTLIITNRHVDDFFDLTKDEMSNFCLLYTSPSPRDATLSRMPSSA